MKKLELSMPSKRLPVERIIGFTIPNVGSFFVCDHDSVWKVTIEPTLGVEAVDQDPYAFVRERRDFVGLELEGIPANAPLSKVDRNAISYKFDPTKDLVAIRYDIAGRTGQIEFQILSGDWFCASFSKDGRFLVLAEPYDIALYEVS